MESPASPYSISEPQNPEIDKFYVFLECPATDFETLICGRVGRPRLALLFAKQCAERLLVISSTEVETKELSR